MRMCMPDDDSTCDLVRQSRRLRRAARKCSDHNHDSGANKRHHRAAPPPSALEGLAEIHRALAHTEHILRDGFESRFTNAGGR
jgi:hypothetical protein